MEQNQISGRDYAIGALIGFLTGVFIIPVLVNLGIAVKLALSVGVSEKVILSLTPLLVAIAFPFGVWFGGFMSRFIGFFAQLGKFAAVGFLNTAIDFGILNLLSAMTGITAGFYLGSINVPAAGIAMMNSYFWNKFWVFRARGGNAASDLPKFVIVSVGAILVNSAIVAIGTEFPAPAGLGPALWLNATKVLATAASFLWNFVGYKLIVFRKAPIAPL